MELAGRALSWGRNGVLELGTDLAFIFCDHEGVLRHDRKEGEFLGFPGSNLVAFKKFLLTFSLAQGFNCVSQRPRNMDGWLLIR